MNFNIPEVVQSIAFTNTVQTMLALAALSLLPFFLMTMTSFLRCVIVLGFIRSAVGTQQVPPAPVITSMALFLTIFIMTPVWQEINETAIQPYNNGTITQGVMWQRAQQPLRQFMLQQVRQNELEMFVEFSSLEINRSVPRNAFVEVARGTPLTSRAIWNVLRQRGILDQEGKITQEFDPEANRLRLGLPLTIRKERAILEVLRQATALEIEDLPTYIIIPAFAISELKTAFQMGFIIFIPFIVIDLIVANILLSLGMFMLSPVMVSLPFKVLLFVLADGWFLVTRGLMVSFGTFQ
jgi:flagellar biosynthetic protein FliP